MDHRNPPIDGECELSDEIKEHDKLGDVKTWPIWKDPVTRSRHDYDTFEQEVFEAVVEHVESVGRFEIWLQSETAWAKSVLENLKREKLPSREDWLKVRTLLHGDPPSPSTLTKHDWQALRDDLVSIVDSVARAVACGSARLLTDPYSEDWWSIALNLGRHRLKPLAADLPSLDATQRAIIDILIERFPVHLGVKIITLTLKSELPWSNQDLATSDRSVRTKLQDLEQLGLVEATGEKGQRRASKLARRHFTQR